MRGDTPTRRRCGRERQGLRHNLAIPGERAWLKTQRKGILAPHPWCVDCGTVKNVGSEAAMKLGGIVNLLSRLERVLEGEGRKITEAQMRLVIRELRALHADDPFALTRDSQVKVISTIVGRHLGLDAEVAESYVRSC